MNRDYQKSKVYDWQSELPLGKFIPARHIDAYVKRIWEAEKLIGPPLVKCLHKNDMHGGKALRGEVLFPKRGTYERVILHELSHSMTSSEVHDEISDLHGPDFVGVFIQLMDKYLNVPSTMSWYLANKMKVDYNMFAKPWCRQE